LARDGFSSHELLRASYLSEKLAVSNPILLYRRESMKVHVRYRVTFLAIIDVPENATHQQIGEALANLNIPEDECSSYDSDSFEPVTDDDTGHPQLYDKYDNPISFEDLGK